jgi:hypothetical protein
MEMSQLHESFRKQKEKRQNKDAAYKAQFKPKGKRNKRRLHDLKQSNNKDKTTNQVRLTALVWR